MDALNNVFSTILNVLDIIKKFFEELFGGFAPKEDAEADAE